VKHGENLGEAWWEVNNGVIVRCWANKCALRATFVPHHQPAIKQSNAANNAKKMQKRTCKLPRYGLNICQIRESQVHGLGLCWATATFFKKVVRSRKVLDVRGIITKQSTFCRYVNHKPIGYSVVIANIS
jgi:hypothetical protein